MTDAGASCYIGLISGTSVDAINAALVRFEGQSVELLHVYQCLFPTQLRQEILALCTPGANEIERLGQADVALGLIFAEAATTLLTQAGMRANQITAIGSHGQTVRHHADWEPPFTFQIGDPNLIAEHTGITTIADFRRRDLAAGGQGAPLAPAFHASIFSSSHRHRAVLNIGGMGNLTLLEAGATAEVIGFDTGPGNVLLDLWTQIQLGQAYDRGGRWAASGKVNPELLTALLAEPYLQLPPPKSTGRERFNRSWLENHLSGGAQIAPADVAATLVEFTATSIADALFQSFPQCEEVYVCGGGAQNSYLMQRLGQLLSKLHLATTEDLGIHPDWVEAAAFAWLAKQNMERKPGNLASVTGAKGARILGGIYPA